MIDQKEMTTGEAEAYRAGYEAAKQQALQLAFTCREGDIATEIMDMEAE